MTTRRQTLTWPAAGYSQTVTAYLWGAGGGAGGNESNNLGGAGTGGGYVQTSFTVNPGDVVEITVGSGGWSGRASNSAVDYTTPIFSTKGAIPVGATAPLPDASVATIATWSQFLNVNGVWNTTSTTDLSNTLTFDQTYSVFFPASIDYLFNFAANYKATVYIDGEELYATGLNTWKTIQSGGLSHIANIQAGYHNVRIVAQAAPGTAYGTWGVGLTISNTFNAGSGGYGLVRNIFDTRNTPASPLLYIPQEAWQTQYVGRYSNLMADFGMWEFDARSPTCSRTYTVYFPYTGTYQIEMAAANTATLTIDGVTVYTTPGTTSYETAYTTDYVVTQGYHTVAFSATLSDPTIIGGVGIVISKSWSGATGGLAGPKGSSGGGGGAGGATTLVLNPNTTNETLLAVAVGGAGGGGAGASTVGQSDATAPGPRGRTAPGISSGQAGQNQGLGYNTILAPVTVIPPVPSGSGFYTRTASVDTNPYSSKIIEWWVVIDGVLVYNNIGTAPPGIYVPGAYQGSKYKPDAGFVQGGQINAFNVAVSPDGGGGGAGGPGGPGGAGTNGYSSVGDSYGQAGTVGLSYLNPSTTGEAIDPTGIPSAGENKPYYSLVPTVGRGAAPGELQAQHGGAVFVFTSFGPRVKDSTTWQEVKSIFVNVNGEWKEINGMYINENGTWREVVGTTPLTFNPQLGAFGLLSRPSSNRPGSPPVKPVTYDAIPVIKEPPPYNPFARTAGGYVATSNPSATVCAPGIGNSSSCTSTGTTGGGCFTGDTMVDMADGTTKRIVDVEPGDLVYNYNRTRVNRVLFVEQAKDFDFEFLYSPDQQHRPFATANHPLYIDGKLSSVTPDAIYNFYPWLGRTELISSNNTSVPTGAMTYNLWTDGDHTYVVNGYGTTSIIGDGGLLRLIVEQELLPAQRVSDLLLDFTAQGKHIVYGMYMINCAFGKLDIKLMNRFSAWVFKDDSQVIAKKIFFGVAKVLGAVACLFGPK